MYIYIKPQLAIIAISQKINLYSKTLYLSILVALDSAIICKHAHQQVSNESGSNIRAEADVPFLLPFKIWCMVEVVRFIGPTVSYGALRFIQL